MNVPPLFFIPTLHHYKMKMENNIMRHFKLKKLLLGLFFLMVCISVWFGFAGLRNWKPEEIDGKITVSFAVSEFHQDYSDLEERFEAEHPNINIQIVERATITQRPVYYSVPRAISFRHFMNRNAGILARNVDVFMPSYLHNEENLLLDLTPLIEKDDSITMSDFYAPSIGMNTNFSGIRILPLQVSYFVVYFNKDHFDTAGIPYPELGWTWEEFKSATEALTIYEGDKVTQYGFTHGLTYDRGGFEDLITAKAGKEIFASDNSEFTLELEDQEIIKATEWVANFYNLPGVLNRSKDPVGWEECRSSLASDAQCDMVSMFVADSGFSGWQNFVASDDQFGVVPLPISDSDDLNTPAFLLSPIVISKYSKHPNEAWLWVKFLMLAINDQYDLLSPTTRLSFGEIDDLDQSFTSNRESVEFAAARSFYRVRPHFYFENHPYNKNGGEEAFQEGVEEILSSGRNIEESLSDFQNSFNENFLD